VSGINPGKAMEQANNPGPPASALTSQDDNLGLATEECCISYKKFREAQRCKTLGFSFFSLPAVSSSNRTLDATPFAFLRRVSSVRVGSSLMFYPHLSVSDYQTRQAFAGIMGCPTLQPKAVPNSDMFWTTPFTRNWRGECGSVCTCNRSC
jgi:hypothetical protein